MKIYEIKMHQQFDAPVETIWEAYNDHANFGRMMGLNLQRIVDSTDPGNVNGTGSVRLIKLPLASFEETVVRSEKPYNIEYKITRGTPLNYHYGKMVFTSLGPQKSSLDYHISVGSNIPFLAAIVQAGLKTTIAASMKKYAARLKK